MKIIGLCGGSGSGKSLVCKMFIERGIPSIDTDSVYHNIISKPGPCVDELVSVFGKAILLPDGSVNRLALRSAVFSSEAGDDSLKRLNSITHKYVLGEVRRIIQEYDKYGLSAVIVDAPLLFESGFNKECHKIICVVADRNIRIARIVLRDGISTEAAERRIMSQLDDATLIERSDYCIVNDGGVDELVKSVQEIVEKIK